MAAAGSTKARIKAKNTSRCTRAAARASRCGLLAETTEEREKGMSVFTGKLQAFLGSERNSFAILQLRRTDETTYERFMSYGYLQSHGKEPDIDHYEVVYVAELPTAPHIGQEAMLEGLYIKFNVNRPADFHGHNLSVSDIVALKIDGVVSCHYVDSIGFKELHGFIQNK